MLMSCSNPVMLCLALKVVFRVPSTLGQQLVGYDGEACEFEVLALPRPLNLQALAMLLPGAVAIQVRYMTMVICNHSPECVTNRLTAVVRNVGHWPGCQRDMPQ